MLVVRFNLSRENRTEEFESMINRVVNHIDKDLGFERVSVIRDNRSVEITTKPDGHSSEAENDADELSVELLVSRSMVVNNDTIDSEGRFQVIKSELKQFARK